MERDGESMARGLAVSWIHLAVLWAFAVTQPMFEVLGDSPEFFVARDNTRWDILVLAFGLTFVPPTALAAIELILSPVPLARRLAHAGFVAVLLAAIALQILDRLLASLGAEILVVLAVAVGTAGAFLYVRGRALRLTLTVLAPAPVVFLAVFLLLSPVSELVLPQESVASSDARLRGQTPVVMLVLDEFDGASLLDRNLAIDTSRYPNFARLAAASRWYPNATTVADDTPRAVPAVLSGSRPGADQLPTAEDHPHNLFTLLGRRYAFNVQEAVTALCPESLCGETAREPAGSRLRALWDDLSIVSLRLLLPEGLEGDLPNVDTAFVDFRDQGDQPLSAKAAPGLVPSLTDRPQQFERFLRGIEGDGRARTLNLLHIMLPHVPYEYLPTGRQYFSEKWAVPGLFFEAWVPESFRPAQAHQRYLLQLGYVDRLLGRLLDRLKSEGLYDRALLVVTADHGVSFRPAGARRAIKEENFAEIANVPLFLKLPGEPRGRIDEGPFETTDLLPTIAEALGIRLPWKVDGRARLRRAADGPVITVANRDGRDVSMGFAAFKRMRRDGVLRRIRAFGGGTAGFFAFGPHAGLIGRDVRRLGVGALVNARVHLDESRLLADVDPSSPSVPAFVSGEIAGDLGTAEPLAVAVNGVIAAVVATWPSSDQVRFSAMVPPDLFRRGPNSVRVYALSGSGESTTLSALSPAAKPAVAGLARVHGEKALKLPGREAIPIVPGSSTGFVEETTRSDAFHLAVLGWAADPSRRDPVDSVVVLVDGRLLGTVSPDDLRPDVAQTLGTVARRSGFRLEAEYPNPERVVRRPDRVRAFAVLRGRAVELPRLGGD